MNYEEFKESLRALVEDGLGGGMTVSLESVSKNNGRMIDTMIIAKKGSEISPSIFTEVFWKMYKKGERIEEIARQIIRIYHEFDVSERIDMNMFFDFEEVKDNIVYKIINKEKNEALLSEVPHVDYLDLAIVFCYIFTEGELEGATILIHNSHLDLWNVKVEHLMECADENTKKILGFRVRSLFDYLKMIYRIEEPDPDGNPEEDHVPMYVLSNKTGLYGAGCILYKGLLKSLSEQMESDFYVFPCSIHEVILMPDNDRSGAEYYHHIIQEINSTEVPKEDVLSDSVYYYSREDDRLRQLA